MTYDLVLYEPWHPIAALHNALYGQGGVLNVLNLFAVDYSMENWANLGVPKHMLLLGELFFSILFLSIMTLDALDEINCTYLSACFVPLHDN